MKTRKADNLQRKRKSAALGKASRRASEALGLTYREIGILIRLLGLLQTHLESGIESVLIPGTSDPMADSLDEIENLRLDRRDWRKAEDLIAKFGNYIHEYSDLLK